MHDLLIERNEVIVIGADIEVSLVEVFGDRARLGINAPRDVSIHRKEVYDAIRRGAGGVAKPTVDPGRAT